MGGGGERDRLWQGLQGGFCPKKAPNKACAGAGRGGGSRDPCTLCDISRSNEESSPCTGPCPMECTRSTLRRGGQPPLPPLPPLPGDCGHREIKASSSRQLCTSLRAPFFKSSPSTSWTSPLSRQAILHPPAPPGERGPSVLGPPQPCPLPGTFPHSMGTSSEHQQPPSAQLHPYPGSQPGWVPEPRRFGELRGAFPNQHGGQEPPTAPQGLPASPGRGCREGSKAAVPHLCFQLVYFRGLDVASFIAFASGEKDPEPVLGVPIVGSSWGLWGGPWCAQRVGSTSPCNCPSQPGLWTSLVWMAPPEVPDSPGLPRGGRGAAGTQGGTARPRPRAGDGKGQCGWLAGPAPRHLPPRGVVLFCRAVKSPSCVSGVQRHPCGLWELLNKRNSSLPRVSASMPTSRCGATALRCHRVGPSPTKGLGGTVLATL